MTATLASRLRIRLEAGGHGALAARVFGSGLIAVLIKIAAAGLSYAMFVVLAKLLAGAEYGKFAFSFNLSVVLATVAGLGATTAIMRFLPEYKVKGRPDLARGALVAGTRWTLVASAATSLAVAAAAPILARWSGADSALHIVMAGLFIPGIALSEYAAAALRAEGLTFWSLAPRDIFWRAGVPLLAALAAWRGLELTAASALLMAAGLLLAITALQALFARRVFNEGRESAKDWPVWTRATLPMWGASILFALVQQFDVVIGGFFLPPAETGAYFAAQKTAALLSLLLIAGNLIGAPLISSYYHAGDRNGLQRLCALLAVGIAVPTMAGFLLMAALGQHLLEIFDPTFVSAYPILIILAAGATFDAAAGPTAYFMQMSGRESGYLKIMALTYVVVIAAQLLLARSMGAIGIALPTAVGVIVWNALAVTLLRRETGVDPSLLGVIALFRSRKAK